MKTEFESDVLKSLVGFELCMSSFLCACLIFY